MGWGGVIDIILKYKFWTASLLQFIFLLKYYGTEDISDFLSPNEHQKQYFHEWQKYHFLFTSEIKFVLALEKFHIFCFFYA